MKHKISGLVIVTLVIGLISAIVLVQKNQDIRERASVSLGEAYLKLEPATGTYYEGATFQGSITIGGSSTAISSVTFQLSYPYTGSTPELEIVDPNGNPSNQIYPELSLAQTGEWNFPIKSVNRSNGKVTVEFAAINTSTTGYASASPLKLATIYFKASRAYSSNPLTISFDPAQSFILTKTDPVRDILQHPTSVSYTVTKDTTPPPPIQNLSIKQSAYDKLTLEWTVPADIGPNSQISVYEIGYSTSVITSTNWGATSKVSPPPTPGTPGSVQNYDLLGLQPGNTYFVAIKSKDSFGNTSNISNVATGTTNQPSLTFGFKLGGISRSGVSKQINLIIRNATTNKTFTQTFVSNSSGVFAPTNPIILSGIPTTTLGTNYDVLVKASGYLQKKLGTVTLRPQPNTGPSTWPSISITQGDFNGDNNLNAIDIGLILSVYTQLTVPVTPQNTIYDVDVSNNINVLDISLVLEKYTRLSTLGDN